MKKKIFTVIMLSLMFTSCSSENIKYSEVPETTNYVSNDDTTKNNVLPEASKTSENVLTNEGENKKDETAEDNTKQDETIIENTEDKNTETTNNEAKKPNTEKTENVDNLDKTKKSWYFMRNAEHKVPSAQNEIDLSKYDAFYVAPEKTKQIFLTFDMGYENGNTKLILDTLKEKNVKACFFLTGDYIRTSPDLVMRMVNEGHVVGNHSYTHPSFPSLTDEQIIKELDDCNNAFKNLAGRDLDPFFRPPMGEYSERTLAVTKNHGYATIFWSLAYKDWLVDDQPTIEEAQQQFVGYVHDGAIVLLHSVSSANANSLASSIDELKAEQYSFISLYDLYN